uniref:Granulin a n=1 Tax=Lates calcarifer TaxID=8187 RepID=A0A4W6E481_LATCA
MQRWVVICWALLALVGAEECPDGGRCEDGQTCCNDPENGYECCPFDQAECCEDHTHCCPAGTICDTAKSSCVNDTVSIPWAERTSAEQPRLKSFRMIKSYMGEEDDNICPDQSRCPPEFSSQVIKLSCSDGKHCCPEGHLCSEDSRSCIKTELTTTVLCSDGVSECPEQTTCCETPEGKWGCCPMPKAVCCEDKLHCCPEGSTCDVEESKCISSSTKKETPMWAKLPARIRAEWESKKGQKKKPPLLTLFFKYCVVYMCIYPPLLAHDCISYHLSFCGLSALSQHEGIFQISRFGFCFPTMNIGIFFSGNNVPCNDTVACEDGSTCCKTTEGNWACCPLPEAVCCDDHLHCCPKGKKCNLAAQTCDDDTCSVPWFKKIPAITKQEVQVGDVTCDSTKSCPDGSTCCKNAEGEWACCPLPEAVCCDDHIHCCPKGKKCNLAAQTCEDPGSSVPWVEKIPAITKQEVRVGDVTCDSTKSCPDGSTCCKNKEDLSSSLCKRRSAVTTTKHCCPTGTTCDLATLSCNGASGSTPMMQKIPAFSTPGRVQCDPHTSCPDSTTCCFMASSQKWGCCPLPDAVCCADGAHCCPTHYKCNEEQTACIKGEVVIPWYTKLPASTTSVEAEPGSARCDGMNQCPEHTSCCRLFTGEWGCCPLQNAVCCPDQEHCCPQGYTCNIASRSCQKLIMLQLETIPLTQVYLPEHQLQPRPVTHRDVQCDDTTSCKDGETCCRTSPSTWGCCPSPNAVCCSDMKHCCPTGYTCTEGGSCTQNTGLHWHNWQVFLANKKRALVV